MTVSLMLYGETAAVYCENYVEHLMVYYLPLSNINADVDFAQY